MYLPADLAASSVPRFISPLITVPASLEAALMLSPTAETPASKPSVSTFEPFLKLASSSEDKAPFILSNRPLSSITISTDLVCPEGTPATLVFMSSLSCLNSFLKTATNSTLVLSDVPNSFRICLSVLSKPL